MPQIPRKPAPERWVNCDLIPAELVVLVDHHIALADDLRAARDFNGAAKVLERASELQLLLSLGSNWATTRPRVAS